MQDWLYNWSARFNPACKGSAFSVFSNPIATLLVLVSPSKIWFLFSASWDLTSRQLPITIMKMCSTETVHTAWKFAFFCIWQCGTFWVSNAQLHEGTLQLLLVQLLWKPQARWRLGQPHPSCAGVNPSASSCLKILKLCVLVFVGTPLPSKPHSMCSLSHCSRWKAVMVSGEAKYQCGWESCPWKIKWGWVESTWYNIFVWGTRCSSKVDTEICRVQPYHLLHIPFGILMVFF